MFGNFRNSSFSVFSDDKTEIEIKKALLQAESEGLTVVDIYISSFFTSLEEGQILQYKTEVEGEVGLLNVYEIIEVESKRIKVKVVSNPELLFQKQKTITPDKIYDIIDEYKYIYGIIRPYKMMIKDNGDYGRILSITIEECDDHELKNNTKRNPHRQNILKDYLVVKYETETKSRINITKPVFDGERTIALDDFIKESKWHIIDDFQKHLIEINAIETTGKLSGFDDILLITGDSPDEQQPITETSLIGFASKEHLTSIATEMQTRKQQAEIISLGVQRSIQLKKEELDAVLAAKEAEIATVMNHLNHAISVFKTQMTKIYMLIDTLEIYYGVNEKIYQIAKGSPAPENEPINLRQMKLFMDEEFGDPSNGGLDFESIEKFDEWLIDSGNYSIVVPEEKCVVIMQPRRRMKDRGKDEHPIIKAQKEQLDRMMYVIIRNGQNIYRIWTDNISFGARLFPLRDELQLMLNDLRKAEEEKSEAIDAGSQYYTEIAEKKLVEKETVLFSYKRNFLFIQGVIMRTEIFKPIPSTLDLLKPETYDGMINFVYDEEMTLTDGRMRYSEWLKEINSSIVKGSRIFLASPSGSRSDHSNRLLKYYANENYPSTPYSGVYQVQQHVEIQQKPIIVTISKEEFEEDKKQAKLSKVNGGDYQRKYYHQTLVNDYISPLDDDYEERIKQRKEAKNIDVYLCNPKNTDRQQYENVTVSKLKILYNPKDTVYAGWGTRFEDGNYERERKNNLSWLIYPEHDTFIINYDALLITDLDYYISNRIDRVNYLGMLPVLRGLKEQLNKEALIEQEFIKMVSMEICKELPNYDALESHQILLECVDWWKNTRPTVWKRPIGKNEAKAFRMIKTEAIKRIKNKFKETKYGK